VAITAAISPYREIRDEVRAATPEFVEVYVRCTLEELVRRDTKGLYEKALRGEIANFTGVSDPYEAPFNPEIIVDSAQETVEESVERILDRLERLGHIWRGVRPRLLEGEEGAALRAESASLPVVEVGPHEAADALMLGTGALSPLSGFMTAPDYRDVVGSGRLSGGQPFPIPVLLRLDDEGVQRIRGKARVALRHQGEVIAVVDVEDIYRTDADTEAVSVYGTGDDAHPGVRLLRASGRWAVGGGVTTPPPRDRLSRVRPHSPGGAQAQGGAGVGDDGRLPDPEPGASCPRVPAEGGPGEHRRAAPAPAGGRDQE
jgi:sulfate adenylyltransferase/3'-phosphoadenosine 5'-phosphosulfate synthase